MCACNTTPCGNQFPDGEASQQKGQKEKGQKSKKDDEHPPPTLQERFDYLKKRALQLLTAAQKLCVKIQKDPFQRQVVRSTVYFSLGLKLFRDLARHLAPKPCGSQL